MWENAEYCPLGAGDTPSAFLRLCLTGGSRDMGNSPGGACLALCSVRRVPRAWRPNRASRPSQNQEAGSLQCPSCASRLPKRCAALGSVGVTDVFRSVRRWTQLGLQAGGSFLLCDIAVPRWMKKPAPLDGILPGKSSQRAARSRRLALGLLWGHQLSSRSSAPQMAGRRVGCRRSLPGVPLEPWSLRSRVEWARVPGGLQLGPQTPSLAVPETPYGRRWPGL
ncbi:unnamed protein product [Rangifer tarandus platyrhynchus]|uniref:Uncharacterized protein n=1 Tax=Rangifer tarandus platyrhynchus TaxID=3082113 RepID=A0ABN8Y9L1_RANTA|nr:unnamed protein product [Rangifer tarandus platyrhynchus]